MKILQTTAVALSFLFAVGATQTQANASSLQPTANGPSSDYFILTRGGHGGHGGHHGGHHGHHGWHGGHHGGHWGHHGWRGGGGYWGGGGLYIGPGLVGPGLYYGPSYRTCYWNSFGQYVCTRRLY